MSKEDDHYKDVAEAMERDKRLRETDEFLKKMNAQARENERLARERREREGK